MQTKIEPKNHPAIADALMHLARQCDGARTRDKVGFDGTDTEFGKSLAGQCDPDSERHRNLSLKQHLAAHKMLGKYQKQLLAKAGIELPGLEEVRTFVEERDAAIALIEAEAKAKLTPAPDGQIELDEDGIKIRFPYDPVKVNTVKDIGGRPKGQPLAKWNNKSEDNKYWELPAEHLGEVRDTFPTFELNEAAQTAWQAIAAQRELDRLKKEEADRLLKLEIEKLLSVANLDEQLPSGRKARTYQQEGAETIFRWGGNVILADEMGLGKSFTALLAAKAYQKLYTYYCPIFVIAPLSLQENWQREAALANVEIEIFSNHHRSLPAPLTMKNYILIVDEAHLFQNPESMRTQAFLELARSPQCKSTMLLTGSPMNNGDPLNTFPLLSAVKHPMGRDIKEFRRHYCRGKGSHLDELHQHIAKSNQPCLLRRLKKDCLDLPLKTRILRTAEISKAANATYMKRFNELRDEYHERIAAGLISSEGEFLVMLTHLRHAASYAKWETTIEMAQEVLGQGDQVVVFAAFKDTAEKLAAALDAEILSGDVAGKDRQALVDRFQDGTRQAIVCTYGAGGLGITLTAATTVILCDRPWTPGETSQAEDRIHRIGQERPTFSFWIQAFEIDTIIDSILQAKQKRIELVLEGQKDNFNDAENMGAKEILAELFD